MHAAYFALLFPIVGKINRGQRTGLSLSLRIHSGLSKIRPKPVRMMQKVGFRNVEVRTFTKGIATLICGDKMNYHEKIQQLNLVLPFGPLACQGFIGLL